jgi:Family of unknown function (DUF5320)
MPAGDRTGPWGAGPRTGRGSGYCSGYGAPGYMSPGPGMGFGRGLGRGYGRGMGAGRGRWLRHPAAWGFWGHPYPPAGPFGDPSGAWAMPPAEEEAALADEAKFLEAELARIRERLEEMKKNGQKTKGQK